MGNTEPEVAAASSICNEGRHAGSARREDRIEKSSNPAPVFVHGKPAGRAAKEPGHEGG